METLIWLLVAVASLSIFVSILQISKLTFLAVQQPGIGRILFLTIVSLKLWAEALLLYLLNNAVGIFRLHRELRVDISLILAVYLVIHAITVNVSVWRWNHAQVVPPWRYRDDCAPTDAPDQSQSVH